MNSVLYVDDEITLLEIGKIYLERSGKLSVDTAISVADAMEKLSNRRYDAIISDYQMPEINGIGFLQYIRQHHHDIPFILFTGRGREEIVIEALNSGADFYLQKGGEPKSQYAELEYKVLAAIDRNRAKGELKDSKKQLADLINFLPDATFAIDLKGRVIVWNRMMEELTGVPPDAVLGSDNYSHTFPLYNERRPALADYIVHAEEQPEKDYPNLLRDGDKLVAEMGQSCLPNGKSGYFWLTASPIYDATGMVVGAIESLRDITQRRENEEKLKRVYEELNGAYEQLAATEEELRQNYDELAKSQQELIRSEERYRNVIEDQTEFICRFTPEGILTFVNDAYCRYFGLDREACIGKLHTVVLPPEDVHLMKQQLAQITPETPVVAIDNRIIMPSGEVRWQRWSDRAIFDRNGRVIEYQSVGRDTTREQVADENLKRAYEELHSAYEQLTATEEELRQNYDELGKSQTELHAAYEQLAAIEEELRQNYDELAKSQQELIRSEERYRNVVEDQTEFICRFAPDGKLTFVNDAYCRYFTIDRQSSIGKPHPVVLPPEDAALMKQQLAQITPETPVVAIDNRIIMPSGEVRWQRWSDRAIFDRNGRVVEYQSVGRDITDSKMLKQSLFESNRKLNLLSSITRHDILNQLTVLQGVLGLLEHETADPGQLRLIAKAIQSSEVIRSQISFTQQYQDIGVRKPLWQNLHDTVMRVSRDDGYPNVVVSEDLYTVEIYADPLLRTVFLNLFENATMHGGKVTQIQVSGSEIPGGFVIIVEDDGEGIPPQDKAHIFRKGFGKHTGLGLFLVQEVLGITGLTIRETGEYGKGARFEIHVPKGVSRVTGSILHSG